jgi:hypothetical protein
MKRFISIFSLLIMVFGLVGPTKATDVFDPPLVIVANGDLWGWTPQNPDLVQLTTNGFNSFPSMSPDGKLLAFITLPDAYRPNDVRDGLTNYPGEMWLLDLITHQSQQLTTQPATPKSDFPGLIRSQATWSPDGKKLAWVELNPSDFETVGYSLVVYDLATHAAKTIATQLPIPWYDAGYLGMIDPLWGPDGIGLDVHNGNGEEILLFSSDGRLIHQWSFEGGVSSSGYIMWVVYQKQSQFAFLGGNDGHLWLMNPRTGGKNDIGTPKLHLLTTKSVVSDKIVIEYTPNPDYEFLRFSGHKDKQIIFSGIYPLSEIAFNAVNENLVFREDFKSLKCWCNGKVIEVPKAPKGDIGDWRFDGMMTWIPFIWLMD